MADRQADISHEEKKGGATSGAKKEDNRVEQIDAIRVGISQWTEHTAYRSELHL